MKFAIFFKSSLHFKFLLSFLFINKNLWLNNLKNRTAVNVKMTLFIVFEWSYICYYIICMTVHLKVVSATFLLVCFVSLKESTCETRKCFLFHFKSSFHSWDNHILISNFKCYNVIKCLSMKHQKHFTE